MNVKVGSVLDNNLTEIGFLRGNTNETTIILKSMKVEGLI